MDFLTGARFAQGITGNRKVNKRMSEINRSLMVVIPKQPFLDWIRAVDDDPGPLELVDLQKDCSAYLVPECDDLEDQMAVILWCWDVVFEEELFSWFTD